MFKIGDKVKVTDSTKVYATYSKMAKMLELTRWTKGVLIPNGGEYTVVDKSFCQFNKELIYAVCDENHEYLIEEDGLAAVPIKNEYCIHYDVVTKEDRNWVVTASNKVEAYDMFVASKEKFDVREFTKELVLDSIEEL